jgi:hypothetical protein
MADIRPGMDKSYSALAHDVFLHSDNHRDQPAPGFFEVRARARDIVLSWQFD